MRNRNHDSTLLKRHQLPSQQQDMPEFTIHDTQGNRYTLPNKPSSIPILKYDISQKYKIPMENQAYQLRNGVMADDAYPLDEYMSGAELILINRGERLHQAIQACTECTFKLVRNSDTVKLVTECNVYKDSSVHPVTLSHSNAILGPFKQPVDTNTHAAFEQLRETLTLFPLSLPRIHVQALTFLSPCTPASGCVAAKSLLRISASSSGSCAVSRAVTYVGECATAVAPRASGAHVTDALAREEVDKKNATI